LRNGQYDPKRSLCAVSVLGGFQAAAFSDVTAYAMRLMSAEVSPVRFYGPTDCRTLLSSARFGYLQIEEIRPQLARDGCFPEKPAAIPLNISNCRSQLVPLKSLKLPHHVTTVSATFPSLLSTIDAQARIANDGGFICIPTTRSHEKTGFCKLTDSLSGNSCISILLSLASGKDPNLENFLFSLPMGLLLDSRRRVKLDS
jgi:hypothetical protein